MVIDNPFLRTYHFYQDTSLKIQVEPKPADSVEVKGTTSKVLLSPASINTQKLTQARKVFDRIEIRSLKKPKRIVPKPKITFDPLDFEQIPYVYTSLDSLHLDMPNFLVDIPKYEKQELNRETPVYKETIGPMNQSSQLIIPVTRHIQSGEWFLFILLLLFATLGWFKYNFNRYLGQVLNGTVSYQVSQRLYRDQNVLFLRVSGMLNVFFIFTTAVFLYQTARYFNLLNYAVNGLWIYLLIAAAFGTLFFIRQVSLRFIGFLFDKNEAFSEYLHNTQLYNKSMALLLLPLILGAAYMPVDLQPVFIFSGITLSISLFVLKIFRGSQIIIRNDVLILYWILYLCTLEILPLIIIYRYLLSLVT